jgi:hypothetical protein
VPFPKETGKERCHRTTTTTTTTKIKREREEPSWIGIASVQ